MRWGDLGGVMCWAKWPTKVQAQLDEAEAQLNQLIARFRELVEANGLLNEVTHADIGLGDDASLYGRSKINWFTFC